MATATLSVIDTELGDWNTTPATPDDEHHTLVNEAYPPGDTDNYISVQGHVNELTDRLILSHGPAGIALVRSIFFDPILVFGATITSSPAIRIRVLVGNVIKAERIIGMETDSEWVASTLSIPFLDPIPALEWYGNSVVIELFPLDGNVGYGPLPQE